jgi:hypothetical protein
MASRRLAQESFRKRKNNFIKRANEIGTRYEADIWICILKNGQLYTYNSSPNRPAWPPSQEDLARVYPAPIQKYASDFAASPAKVSKPRTYKAAQLPSLRRPPMPEYVREEIFSEEMMASLEMLAQLDGKVDKWHERTSMRDTFG